MTSTEPTREASAAPAATRARNKPFHGALVAFALVALVAVGFLAARHYLGQPIDKQIPGFRMLYAQILQIHTPDTQ